MEMILAKAGANMSARTARKGLRSQSVAFYKLKEKPLLQPGDIKERRKWADAHSCRSRAQWGKTPHAIIDNKPFQMSRCAAARDFVARRSLRGAYQTRGAVPMQWLVKPSGGINKVKFPGVQVTAAVIKGKIRVWHYVDGKWNAKNAAHMYTNVLAKALKRAYPRRRLQRHSSASTVDHNFRKLLARPATFHTEYAFMWLNGITSQKQLELVTDSRGPAVSLSPGRPSPET